MPQGTLKKVVRTYQEVDVSPVSPSSTIQGCEGEWSAFDPLPKLTQASDKDVRIIIGKERESYEPELNYTGCEQKRSANIHSVSYFCFVVFRPHSLLDFLESRVMKRKSINHCAM